MNTWDRQNTEVIMKSVAKRSKPDIGSDGGMRADHCLDRDRVGGVTGRRKRSTGARTTNRRLVIGKLGQGVLRFDVDEVF